MWPDQPADPGNRPHGRVCAGRVLQTRPPALLSTLLSVTLLSFVLTFPLHAQQVELTPHAVLEVGESVSALGFSSAGDRLLVGGDEGGVSLLEVEDQVEGMEGEGIAWSTQPESGQGVAFVSFLPGDSLVVVVDEEGSITVRSADQGQELHQAAARSTPVRIALDADGHLLAVAGSNTTIELFRLPDLERSGEIVADGMGDDPLFLGFDRRGGQLLAVAGNGEVVAWNPSTLEPLRHLTLQGEVLHGSRSVVQAVGQDGRANILVVALQEVALPRGGLRGRARPDDLVREDQLLVYDWYSGAQIRGVNVVDGAADAVVVGPGNDHAVVSREAEVTVMDLRRGDRGAQVTAPAQVESLAIAPDQGRLAIGSTEGHVAVWTMVYREPQLADLLDGPQEGIGGRIRVLGDDTPAIHPDEPIVMAVLPFDDREGEGRMSQTVAELLVTQLANLEHLTLVERMRIDDLLAEQELQREGVTEDGGMELGQMLNADYVLLGSIGASGSSITFSARLLDVATGEVVSGRQVLCEECRAQDLFDAIHLLGGVIAR